MVAYKAATQPLELFFADRDCRALLSELQAEQPGDARLVRRGQEIDALGARHAAAIAKGSAFFEGPEAQANFAERQTVEAERNALNVELEALQRERDEAQRAGLLERSMNLDTQLRAKRRVLDLKGQQLGRLQAAYEKLAEDSGVYTRP